MRPFQLPYLYQRVFIFFFAPTPWRCVGAGTAALSSYRRSSAINGHHHYAYPRSSDRPHLSFPWTIPERRTRRIKRLAPSYRRSSAINGHHHFAYPRSSDRPHPSFPWTIPERRTRRIKRLTPPDRRQFQARVPQFADNVNSHPDVARGDSQPHPIGRGVKTSHQP